MITEIKSCIPRLFPLLDKRNKPLKDGYKLVYHDLILYYSHSELIAWRTNKKLFVRTKRWNFIRAKRGAHRDAIIRLEYTETGGAISREVSEEEVEQLLSNLIRKNVDLASMQSAQSQKLLRGKGLIDKPQRVVLI